MATPTLTERRKSKKVDLLHRNIIVNELTVKEVNGIMENLEKTEGHMIDMLFGSPLPVEVLSLSSGLSPDEMVQDFTQEELASVIAGVEEVNDRLKKMFDRLNADGQKLASTVTDLLGQSAG